MIEGLRRWFEANLQPDGELPYLEGRPDADNALRRFLATWAMARAGMLHEARLNLGWNMARYYRDGRIEEP